MAEPTREEIDAKIAASEARTDAKFTELLRHIDGQTAALQSGIAVLGARMEAVERSTSGTKATVIGTGIAALALGIAAMGYGAQWFGLGLDSSDKVEQIVRKAVQEQAQTNEQIAQRAAESALSNYRRSNPEPKR